MPVRSAAPERVPVTVVEPDLAAETVTDEDAPLLSPVTVIVEPLSVTVAPFVAVAE